MRRFFFLLCFLGAQATWAQTKTFDVPAQAASTGVPAFARQADVQLLISAADAEGKRTNAVKGTYAVAEALELLLADTGLVARSAGPATWTIVPVRDPARPARAAAVLAMPEILVQGSRLLNMDIPRSRDDIQPYVILDSEMIAQSGARDVDTFLKQRLPMNSVALSGSQLGTNVGGNQSTVNLRGLGPNQTLILVDGRRMLGVTQSGSPQQPDINTIPLAAIERIEVLPTSASAIYGGSATGGVVNIILRRDYSGAEVKVTYDDTWDFKASGYRVDAAFGAQWNAGRTSLLLTGSYGKRDPLAVGDREFVQRGRSVVLQNNPALLLGSVVPPLGATPNIVSVNGSPLFGPGTPNFTFVPVGHTGGRDIAPYLPNAGSYNFDLAGTSQLNGGREATLLNGPTIKALAATLRHRFTAHIDAFVEASTATNTGRSHATLASGVYTLPAAAPTNPFGQAVRVTVPVAAAGGVLHSESRVDRAAAGVIAALSPEWRASLDYTWSRSSIYSTLPNTILATAAAAINSGALDILRDPAAAAVDFTPYIQAPRTFGPFESTLDDVAIRAAGPIAKLPAGNVTLSTMLEERNEKVKPATNFSNATLSTLHPDKSQKVSSAYVEAMAPLLGSKGAGGFELEGQAALRWDKYKTEGTAFVNNPTAATTVDRQTNTVTSTNPMLGLRFRPMPGVMARASYSTGFLPPAINQILPDAPSINPATVIDPRRGGATTTVPAGQVVGGGNPRLQPEESKSVSAGVVFTPFEKADTRLSIDYTRIEKTNEIRFLQVQEIVDNELSIPGRVVRAPAAANDPFGVGAITAIDATAVNVAASRLEAIDVAFDHSFRIAAGKIGLYLVATFQPHYKTRIVSGGSETENAGVSYLNPLKRRVNAGVSWEAGALSAGWGVRYYDSYFVVDPASSASASTFRTQGSDRVPSQTYHDVFFAYKSPARVRSGALALLLDDVVVRAGINNLFDKAPPFDANAGVAVGSFYYSFFGDPRLRNFYVSLAKAF